MSGKENLFGGKKQNKKSLDQSINSQSPPRSIIQSDKCFTMLELCSSWRGKQIKTGTNEAKGGKMLLWPTTEFWGFSSKYRHWDSGSEK